MRAKKKYMLNLNNFKNMLLDEILKKALDKRWLGRHIRKGKIEIRYKK